MGLSLTFFYYLVSPTVALVTGLTIIGFLTMEPRRR
jgi:hypothetical protein